ncbi:MAG: peroxiredoxin-like family protein [Burkholderiaceae bacterium]|jgi:peroxiredoxin
MKLNDLLDTYWRHAAERKPAVATALDAEARAMVASGRLDRALRAGDRLPEVTVPDAGGGHGLLGDRLRNGPLVVVFYRGRWCPFCTLELRAWQRVLPEIRALGGQLLAVSPQDERETALMRERDRLEFEMFADSDNTLARRFGIAYEVAQSVREAYCACGMEHGPAGDGAADWTMPLPAVYLIGTDRKVAWAYVDPQWNRRAEPADVVARLAAMSGR